MTKLLEQIPVAETYQKLIGIFIVILGTVLAVLFARFLLYVVARQLASKTTSELDDKLLIATRRQFYWLVYLIGLNVLFNYIQSTWQELLGEKVFHWVDGLIYAVGVILVSNIIVRSLSAFLDWYGKHVASKTDTHVDDEFVPLIDRVAKTTIYVLAILIILDHFSVDIKGLLAVLGVGSLAIALAAKDTISNMIGGFIIMVDRPFRIGDRVMLADGTVCVVNHIGVRSTKFLTFDNTFIITPNAELMNSTIHNMTYPYPQVRVVIDVGVGYDSNIKLVRDVMLEEANQHEKVLKNPDPYFVLLNFGDSSLDVSLRCRVANVEDQFLTTCQLREQILQRFRDEGIEIPFPQRVVTMVADNSSSADSENP